MQNYRFTPAQQQQALRWLVFFHILVIAASNYLVQFPFSVTLPNGFEVHSTWGALSFPFIFLATDLTVRIFGQSLARRIIFFVMFPALLVSYTFSVLFQEGAWTGWGALAVFVMPVFRIALAVGLAWARCLNSTPLSDVSPWPALPPMWLAKFSILSCSTVCDS